MPAFVAALLVGLVPILTGTFFKVLAAIGIGVMTFTGINLALEQLHAFAASNWGSLPAGALGIVGLLRIDQALNLIISAVVAKFTLKGLSSGTLKAFALR